MFPRALTVVLILHLLAAAAPARAAAEPVPSVGSVGSAADPVGVWPLQPEPDVVSGFDPPDDPWGAGHRGVDLAGQPGQPVRAAMAGRVSFAGQLAGRGVVVVDHGDTRTTYEPVVATAHVGDHVTAGGMIGRLSVPFSHCFPSACLHWGWLRGDIYLDPLELVASIGPVRLLPLWRDRPVPPPPAAAPPPLGWWRPVYTP